MEKKKVVFIKNAAGQGFGYFQGQEGELKKEDADKLIDLGICKAKEENPNGDLPEDMPSLKHLHAAGIKTREELKDYTKEELIELDGIGETYAVKILEEIKSWEA